MAGHIVPKKIYFMVFASLLALTALTTLVAYMDLDSYLGIKLVPMNTIVALAIARGHHRPAAAWSRRLYTCRCFHDLSGQWTGSNWSGR